MAGDDAWGCGASDHSRTKCVIHAENKELSLRSREAEVATRW